MLGNGRPFLVELFNPRKPALDASEVETLQSNINSSTDLVEVKQLQVMTKAAAAFLKQGEEEKRKEYSALVWTPDKLTQEMLDKLGEMKDTVIQQKTPIRVLHRRSLATRARTIHT
jgi:tRNA pseudouridine synthase 10